MGGLGGHYWYRYLTRSNPGISPGGLPGCPVMSRMLEYEAPLRISALEASMLEVAHPVEITDLSPLIARDVP